MKRGVAAAKINLALVVGQRRRDGRHELLTVYQRIALADRIEVRRSEQNEVTGFADDTLVARALGAVTADDDFHLAARIDKRIPVAAGLGGGSADAAAALALGNQLRSNPLSPQRLEATARELGADGRPTPGLASLARTRRPAWRTSASLRTAPRARPRRRASLLADDNSRFMVKDCVHHAA